MKKDIREHIRENVIILDGAMGTMLMASGASDGVCPEALNITRSELIRDIHRRYAESGAQVIYSNTFGANSAKLPKGYGLEQVIAAALENAGKVAAGRAWVAYNMGPSGRLLEPLDDFTFDEAYELFKEQVLLAKKHGADLIVCETFSSLYEIKAAILAAKENCDLPVFATMSFEENGRTFQGTDVRCMALTLEGLGADAIGINCSLGPAQILPIARELVQWTDLPVIVKANAGMPKKDGTYSVGSQEFADVYEDLLECGVSIIGGCCGTGPEYIARLAQLARGKKPKARQELGFTAVCSAVRAIRIEGVRVVGERLNPTGKKAYRQALIEGDMDYILEQGYSQCEAGAEILDVNAGIPDIDEAEVLPKIVKELQANLHVPLQIDSSKPEAIERALRYYNGKPIVNSVNGDEQSLNAILPLVKKYGACVVGLTLDERGLPEDLERRLEIARKIEKYAQSYGIKKRDLIFDTLALAVSAEQGQARHTLEAVRAFSSMGYKTLLGISNTSYGMPNREAINAAFLTMALQCGLNLPIINPQSEVMMGAIRAFKVISGIDEGTRVYLEAYGAQVPAIEGDALKQAIIKGLETECREEASRLLEKTPPLEVINGYIIPALDEVGALYEKGKFFLPQLIRASESAKAAFEEIKKRLPKAQNEGEKILLATVKGDVHDIGKNIVKTVLENYGYCVVDLGKNVEPQQILNVAREQGIRLVGLSALMTTTVSSMEATIRLIRESGYECSIVVGGAVLTEDYAKKIGADFYAKDANAAIKIVKEFFGS